jgi:carboxyl-terminal processing protease
MDGGLVKVVSPIDHTPAQKAGVRAGDVITHVDNVSLRGLTLAEAVARMRGRFGTTVTITLRRQDGETLSLTLTRATIRIPPVRFRLVGGIGYVRITAFNEQTTEGLRHAIANLGKQLDGARLDLVLDLRRNPGGLLSQAVSVTDTFLAEGLIVSTLGRIEKLNQRFEAKPGDIGESTALVVLIDGGSASASEVVASALQYHGRAVVMGARSFGKGTVQTIIPLPQGTAVRPAGRHDRNGGPGAQDRLVRARARRREMSSGRRQGGSGPGLRDCAASGREPGGLSGRNAALNGYPLSCATMAPASIRAWISSAV